MYGTNQCNEQTFKNFIMKFENWTSTLCENNFYKGPYEMWGNESITGTKAHSENGG